MSIRMERCMENVDEDGAARAMVLEHLAAWRGVLRESGFQKLNLVHLLNLVDALELSVTGASMIDVLERLHGGRDKAEMTEIWVGLIERYGPFVGTLIAGTGDFREVREGEARPKGFE
jgi:hypothetical protein